MPEGAFLLAELEGELAAAPLDVSEPVIADPFRPTADASGLLERQARRLRRSRTLRGRRPHGTPIALRGAA